MKIKLTKIKVKELYKNFNDGGEENGVWAYDNKLSVRPQYQREFIYKPKQQENVIKSILHYFPLNVMYWVKNGDKYELLDGQQRTMSICNFIKGVFSVNNKYFHSLTSVEQYQIEDYELQIYICEGNDKEKIEWFQVINTGTAILTQQEIKNAIYSGTYVTTAKKYFSKTQCPAYQIAGKYLSGSSIRQDYLETILKWISKDNIEQYMSSHQHNKDANELIEYFNNIFDWVKKYFEYRKEMQGLSWGFIYDEYKNIKLDKNKLTKEINNLMEDEEIQNKKGIYEYVLDRKEKHLNLRQFSEKEKRIMYERQKGKCAKCKKAFEIEQMHGDHKIPWSKGGKTTLENGQLLCRDCNLAKSDN